MIEHIKQLFHKYNKIIVILSTQYHNNNSRLPDLNQKDFWLFTNSPFKNWASGSPQHVQNMNSGHGQKIYVEIHQCLINASTILERW